MSKPTKIFNEWCLPYYEDKIPHNNLSWLTWQKILWYVYNKGMKTGYKKGIEEACIKKYNTCKDSESSDVLRRNMAGDLVSAPKHSKDPNKGDK